MTSWYLALHRWVGIWRIVITNVAWKVSVFVVFLVRIFPHSDWIRTRKTPMIYLTVANVFSIHHILFYITNMFIVDGFLQKYFQNRNVCGITFTTTGLSSLASHMSIRLVFCRTEIQGFFHGHTKQLWVPILGGPICHHKFTSGSIPSYRYKCLIYNTKWGHVKVTVVSCNQECIFCYCSCCGIPWNELF